MEKKEVTEEMAVERAIGHKTERCRQSENSQPWVKLALQR